ncbi:hypothetical protein LTR10_008219 [Elasticomyces elasticus]|nr:hypothetical protein LTR10_008219 [Elasticomyces elasticus]KAK4967095.1 hypothetical protein LTR42_010443 [Elasticomyces elasticus]
MQTTILILPTLLAFVGAAPQSHGQTGAASLINLGVGPVVDVGAFTCEPKEQLACAATDLTPRNWVSNRIDDIVFCRMVPSMDGPAIKGPNQPHAYISFEANGLRSDEFDCSDFNHPERCSLDIQSTPTPCDFFQSAGSFAQDGFIAQSFINIYFSLRNMYFAVQEARDELINERFVDDMVKNLGRVKTPIPRSVLFKLVNLSLVFLPNPASLGAAADIAAARAVAKTFKTIDKTLVKGGLSDAEAQESNERQQPVILRSALTTMASSLQDALQEQLRTIFSTEHAVDDGFYEDLLRDGVHLGPVISQDDYKKATKQNMRSYLIAQFLANAGAIFAQDGICSGPDLFEASKGKICLHFGYSEGAGVPATGVTIDHAVNSGALVGFGLSLETIGHNAFECKESGRDMNNVDFVGFLESGTSTGLPDCLFGIPVV